MPPDDQQQIATEAEWKIAKKFFKDNTKATKLAKKGQPTNKDTSVDTSLKHSFVKINGTIYAMEKLSKGGGEATIKKGQTEDGATVAIRVTGSKTPESTKAIMQKLGKLKGVASRTAKEGKEFKGKTITEKSYEAVELIEGKDLSKVINENHLDTSQKFKAALMAAECIKKMHDKGVIHLDIKSENLMIDLDANGQVKSVNEVDYGFAALLDENGQFPLGKDEARGTQGFMAPEVENAQAATTASDVYSLGQMLKIEMGIDDPIIEQMLASDPAQRPNMDAVVERLNQLNIENKNNHEKDNTNLLDQVRAFENANDNEKIRILAKIVTIQHQDKDKSAELFAAMDTTQMKTLMDAADNLLGAASPDDVSKRGFAVAAVGLMRNELYEKIVNSDKSLNEKCIEMKKLPQQLINFKNDEFNKMIERAQSIDALKAELMGTPEMSTWLSKVQKYEEECFKNPQEAINNSAKLATKNINIIGASAIKEMKSKLNKLMIAHLDTNFNPMANPDISQARLAERLQNAQKALENEKKVVSKTAAPHTSSANKTAAQEQPKEKPKQENKGALSMFQRAKQKFKEVKKDAKDKLTEVARAGTRRLK